MTGETGAAAARPLWQGRMLALLGVALVAFSLRSAVAALSPIIAEIERDMAVPTWVVGIIGTAPPVCFALFGILTPLLERRFGLERLAVMAMLVVAAGTVLRAVAGDATLLVVGTAVLFAGVGIGNVVLPPLVKAYFPDRIGLMTAVYSTTLAVSTLIPPLFAVPVADAVDWRFSLGMWSVFAAIAIVPWLALSWHQRTGAPARDAPRAGVLNRLFRLPLAWALAGTFAISSSLAYTGFAWLPIIVVDLAGVSHTEAGLLLSLSAAVGLPVSMLVPLIITRTGRVGILYVVAVATGAVGIGGLLLAPTLAVWLWMMLYGIAQLLFPVVLVLVQVRTRTHAGSVAASGFAQSIGYAIAASAPLGFGVLHEATGGWTVPLLALGAVLLIAIPAGIIVARPTTIEDDWEQRHGRWS